MKSKCRTCSQDCVHYDSFFGSCNLYYEQKGATNANRIRRNYKFFKRTK